MHAITVKKEVMNLKEQSGIWEDVEGGKGREKRNHNHKEKSKVKLRKDHSRFHPPLCGDVLSVLPPFFLHPHPSK